MRPTLIQAAGATGLAVGLAIGGYGFASAATGSSGPTPAPSASAGPGSPLKGSLGKGTRPGLAAAAAALHLSVADLRARLAAGKTIAAVAADQHVPVNDVIDAMVADAQAGLRDRITAEVNGTGPMGKGPMGKGPLGNGPASPFRGQRGPGGDIGVVATALGITPAELRTDLQNGQSIAAVARAKGIDPQTVIDAVVKDRTAKLDQAVTDGKITQAQEDRLKATLPQRVADQVNAVHKPA